MSEVYVIGHRNPDTDAICSALGYAEFKRRTDTPNAVAARCGETNARVDFILDTFGMEPPVFVSDVSPKVRDVMEENVVSLSPRATVAEALGTMDERNIRVLPIVDDNRSCLGLVSVFKMSKFFFPTPRRVFDTRRVVASVDNLQRALGAERICGRDTDQEEELILMIGAMSIQEFSERFPKYPPERLLVVVGDREDVQSTAIEAGVRVLVVTGGLDISPKIKEAAKRQGVSLLSSPHDSATTAILCRTAIPVGHMLHKHFLTFEADENLADIQSVAAASQFQAFPVLNSKKQMIGILSKSDFLRRVDRELILVDHNELNQAVRGADEVDIIEVVDHHRIGNMTTQQPILFYNEPVGSTSTIVADCFFRYGLELSRGMAGLLLAGLVSDTLNLTSPTTTAKDEAVLRKLEPIANVNATQFTEKLFEMGSVLTHQDASDAIAADCKEYQENERRFSVAQIEEIGFDQFLKRKDEVIKALQAYREAHGYYFSSLLVTDVVRQSSLLLISGPESLLERIDYPEREEGIFILNGVVSRKKQLLPYLVSCLNRLG